MARVATTKRCDECRMRRVKCDQCWPCCGPCRRRKIQCSGLPRSFTQFIAHQAPSGGCTLGNSPSASDPASPLGSSSNAAVSEHDKPSSCTKSRLNLELIQTRQQLAHSGGGMFARFRPKLPCLFAQVLNSTADRSAQKIVYIINATDQDVSQALVRTSWLHHLPSRMVCSSVLCNAADVFADSWIFCQKVSLTATPRVPNAITYIRAIKSLRLALSSSEQAYSTAILAAVALLSLSEEKYAGMRQNEGYANKHMSGLQSIMTARGPPVDVHDELEMQIIFESMSNLLSPCIMNNNTHEFHQPKWISYMERALEAHTDSRDWRGYLNCRLQIYIAWWPHLAASLNDLFTRPDDRDGAELLAEDTSRLVQALLSLDGHFIQPLLEDSNKCRIEPDVNTLGGFAYDFDEWKTCQVVISAAMVGLVFNQILLSTLLLCGAEHPILTNHFEPPSVLVTRLKDLSKRVWRCLSYTERQLPMRQLTAVSSLILSLQYCDVSKRDFMMEKLYSLSNMPQETATRAFAWTKIDSLGKRLTGRLRECKATH